MMEERQQIEKPHSEMGAFVSEAKSLLRTSLAQFLADVERVDALLVQARETARAWNQGPDSKTLMLPDNVSLSRSLTEIRAAVGDVVVSAGAYSRPLSVGGGQAREVADAELAPQRAVRVKLRDHVTHDTLPRGAELVVSTSVADRWENQKMADRVEV